MIEMTKSDWGHMQERYAKLKKIHDALLKACKDEICSPLTNVQYENCKTRNSLDGCREQFLCEATCKAIREAEEL